MAWRKLQNPTANDGNNTLVTLATAGCCEGDSVALKTCVITGHNVSSSPIDTIRIDGVDYGFTAANTGLLLESRINTAMEEAGYIDVDGYGTLVSGANSSVYVRIVSDATITRLVTTGDSNVNFTCS